MYFVFFQVCMHCNLIVLHCVEDIISAVLDMLMGQELVL